MSRCNVNPIPLVMRVLILLDASHIQGTVSHISSVTFESSCVALNWSAAETDCSKKNATIFTLLDLAAPIGGKVLLNATAEHTRIWIEINGTTCKTASSESFLPASCSDTNYYVCKGNTSTSPDRYVPCREGSADTSTQGSSGSTALNLSTTTQGSNSKVTVISVVTCGILALVAVTSGLGCYFIQRKKPAPLGNHQVVAREGQAEEHYFSHLEAGNASETNNYATLHDPANIGRISAIQLDD
ncbi:uncharacterized protein LOC124257045 isoform X7 [Haliotis rubra]|uniref:uncharacterized protein LOC124257045 isoform X7 n=1 Tax=Haliotis rubra TaxID=36100 RepID=UPI001EE625F0|nr:uncharacterized protein LOC124257045 isoform X7 [Haliotis rubra]